MNLILQAIKSLIRKVENAVSQTVMEIGKLKKQLTTLNTNLSSVRRTAQKAQTAADDAQTAADDAKIAAIEAKSVADNANRILSTKANYTKRIFPYPITDALKIAIGETFTFEQQGYMFPQFWSSKGILEMKFEAIGNGISYEYPVLTCSSNYTANGVLFWTHEGTVFLVDIRNSVTTSIVRLTRLA